MKLAKIGAWIDFIFAIVLAFISLKSGPEYFLIIILIGLAAFASAWPLYGFGQIVDDIHVLRNEGKDVIKEELPKL